MTRYDFYNNLELFHKTKEIIQQEEQEKIQSDLNELKHYGTKGQKWGIRKWQNYDGTFNEAGKERYFGKSSKTASTEEDKVGSARSDVKDYLKFRNKMLKKRTRGDLNKWYRDNNKAADKQLLKDAKKVDKQREKMYKNQLRDFYEDPNELVSDLDRIYKIGGEAGKSSKNKWPMNDLFKKAGYDYDKSDDETRELFEMEINDIRSSYKNGNDINKLSKEFGYDKNFIQDVIDSDPDQKVGSIFNKKATNENGEEYNPKYQYSDGSLTWEGRQLSLKKAAKKINSNMLEDYKNKESERKEAERIEQEAKENKVKEILNDARSNVKLTKELKGKDISDEELQNIINDLDNYSSWENWDKLEKNNRNEFDKIADLGLDALARSSKYYSSNNDVGDDSWRDWFVYEDQTIGLPQITKLYYDGYSKDYINKMIDKVSSMSYEDYDKKYGEDSAAKFFVDQTDWQNQNKKFVEALFDPDYNAKDQKIGGLFNKTPEEKAEKKAIKEAKKINDELEEEYLYDRRHWDEVANAYINESEFSPLFENIRKSNNEKLSKDYDKVNDIFKDYLENEDEYVTRAAIANSIISEETTLENIGRMTRLYLMDDLDQGYANSSDLYARYEKNIDDKEIERLYQSLHNNKDMYNENVKYLKDNNKVLSKVNDMLLLELCKENEDEHNTTRKNRAYWRLYDAADGSTHNGDLEKDAYNSAKKITEKLHKSCSGNDGWDFLNQAIENLDMNSKELRDMTQADWDKINAEINKLKK